MLDGGLQVVDHQRLGHAAEMPEGVLQHADEVLRRLREGGLAVRLARVAEHDAEDMRLAPLAVGADDRRASAEIHLGFLARPRIPCGGTATARLGPSRCTNRFTLS